jgi:hypothetical protein
MDVVGYLSHHFVFTELAFTVKHIEDVLNSHRHANR